MAAQKSIAKGAGTHSTAHKGKAAVRQRRAREPRSSAESSGYLGAPPTRTGREGDASDQRGELLQNLSERLALVETASLALQKFEDEPEIGAVCASLEHAVQMLASAHEQVDLYLRGQAS